MDLGSRLTLVSRLVGETSNISFHFCLLVSVLIKWTLILVTTDIDHLGEIVIKTV